jgi:hypothetical protein
VAVILSINEYERLMALENAYWAQRAKKAQESGYLGEGESMKILKAAMDES